MPRAALRCLGFLAAVLRSLTASAEPLAFQATQVSARLVYNHDPTVQSCPDAQALRYLLIERFGYQPIRDDAPSRLVIDIAPRGAGLHAELSFYDVAEHRLWAQHLQSADRCDVLASQVTLAVRAGLDRTFPSLETVSPAIAASEPPISAPPPVVSPPIVPPPPEEVRERWPKGRVAAGAGVVIARAPAPAPELWLELGIRWPHASISLAALGDPRVSRSSVGIGASFIGGSVAPCAHYSIGFVCAVVTLGQSRVGTIDSTTRDRTLYVGAGARLGVEIPFARHFAVRLSGEASARVRGATVEVDETYDWTTPGVSGTIASGLVVTF